MSNLINETVKQDNLKQEISFEQKFKILQEYANDEKLGNGNISNIMQREVYKGYPVGQWINAFRLAHRRYRYYAITDEQAKALETLGMVWEPLKNAFELKMEVLAAYKNDILAGKGLLENIARNTRYTYNGEEHPIGRWLDTFRDLYRKNKLSQEKISRIEQLGIKWNEHRNFSFDEKLEVLTAYVNDTSVSGGTIANITPKQQYTYKDRKYPIGIWIVRYRRIHKGLDSFTLPAEQIDKLESLGMVWEVAIPFDVKAEVLLAYKNDANGGNGTIRNISAKETYIYNGTEYPIGAWIGNFRNANKGCGDLILTSIQKQILENMGMAWVIRHSLTIDERIYILEDYAKNVGNGTIANIKKDTLYKYNGVEYEIRAWITTFKVKKDKELTAEQIKRLENIGIIWNERVKIFSTKLEVLNAYKNDIEVSGGTIAKIAQRESYEYNGVSYPIGHWMDIFRQAYKKKNINVLTINQIKVLENLGMAWDRGNERGVYKRNNQQSEIAK